MAVVLKLPDDNPLVFTGNGTTRVLTNYDENGTVYTVRTAAFVNNALTRAER